MLQRYLHSVFNYSTKLDIGSRGSLSLPSSIRVASPARPSRIDECDVPATEIYHRKAMTLQSFVAVIVSLTSGSHKRGSKCRAASIPNLDEVYRYVSVRMLVPDCRLGVWEFQAGLCAFRLSSHFCCASTRYDVVRTVLSSCVSASVI